MQYLNMLRGVFFKAFSKISADGLISIGRNAIIRSGSCIHLGRNFNAGNDFWLEAVRSYFGREYNPVIDIGHNFIANNSNHIACAGKITIGNDVLIGSFVIITDHAHGIYNTNINNSSPLTPPCRRELSCGHITIGDRVWIGDKVSIIGSVSIGSGVIVAANSVVVHDIPDDVIVAGSPAVIIKKWNKNSKVWERYISDNY